MKEYGTLHAEPIKVGEYKGNRYFVNMNQFLWLNGYAEIPENWKDGEEDYIDVHGGVTFKGYLMNDQDKVRVIGFDTMHVGDSPAYWNLSRVEEECKHLINGIIEVMEEDNEETEEEE